jgi:hypothetical protein
VDERDRYRSTSAREMLDHLEGKASARKFRLYHCALLRSLWPSLERPYRQAIEETEGHFDSPAGSSRPAARQRASKDSREEATGHLVEETCLILFHSPGPATLRCIFGDPYVERPPLAPSVLQWNGGTVGRLAEAAYEERVIPGGTLDPQRLAVLSDALEEAGADAGLVDHLRGPGPHYRGCHALDLILGKE